MRVLITDDCHPILASRLVEAGFEVVTDATLEADSLLSIVSDFDALVVRSKISIDARFLDSCGSRLRCIGRLGAGMETIDVSYAEAKGIRCLNSPEGNRDAVGEHATALLLSLFDRINLADAEVRQGLWRREANRGIEVKGKTVGIIGFGNMGAAFAQRLRGFECHIVAYDKYKAHYAPSYVEEVSLSELQQRADVVSLHVPLTEETHYLVDEQFFSAMAKPFFLINTARGAVVHTAALAEALSSGKVMGAGLDVVEYENMAKDGLDIAQLPADFRYLLQCPRVVLTPHVGGWTVESKYKLAAVMADKIITLLNN